MAESKELKVPANFEPREYQLKVLKALDEGIKRAVLVQNRRAGKDVCSWAYLIKEAFRVPGTYYYAFPEYGQGRRALWEEYIGKKDDPNRFRYLSMIPGWDNPGDKASPVKRVNNQEMIIELKNGSFIRLIGSDQVDRFRGSNFIGIVFSEYADHRPDVWDVMEPVLRANGGWAIFNGTPKGRNHFYNLVQAAKSNPQSWALSELQTLWPDRPNYYETVPEAEMKDVIKQALDQGKDMIYIEQEYGTCFASGVQGAYFKDVIETARERGRIDDYKYNDNYAVHTFWDIGLSDDTAIWFAQRIGGNLVFIDYYEEKGKTPAFYAQILQEKGYRYGTHFLPHDGMRRNNINLTSYEDALRIYCVDLGISDDVQSVPRVPNKQIAIDQVRGQFAQYCFDMHECRDGLAKLELYHRKYDPRNQTFMAQPVHDWTSHAADALTTAALCGIIAPDSPAPLGSDGPITVISDYDHFGDN